MNEKYIDEWHEFKNRFDKYTKIFRIAYPHKRFRIINNVILNNSPLSLLNDLPKMTLITYDSAFDADGMNHTNYPHKIYKYSHSDTHTINLEIYFNPVVLNGVLSITSMGSLNSAAIALYPLINYMWFKKVFFIGMDMSLLESLEYS